MNVSEDLLNTETVNVAATGVPDEAMSKISELSRRLFQIFRQVFLMKKVVHLF